MVKDSISRFLEIKCGRCGSKQRVFGKSSQRVKCLRCNKLLGQPTGGKLKIRTMVTEVFKIERIS